MKRIALALALLPFAAAAVEDKEIAACAADKNAVTRLSCFDDLATRHALAPSTTDTSGKPGAGAWATQTSTDPMTDKSIHMAILLSETGRSKYGKPIALLVRCANNKTDLWLNWESYLGNSDVGVTYRVDKEKPRTASWNISSNNTGSFFPGSPVAVLKAIAQSASFVANVTPYNESPVTAVFDTTGADAALADIRKGCGW